MPKTTIDIFTNDDVRGNPLWICTILAIDGFVAGPEGQLDWISDLQGWKDCFIKMRGLQPSWPISLGVPLVLI